MHIHKSSFYSAAITTRLRNGNSIVERLPQRRNPVRLVNRPHEQQNNRAENPQHPHTGQKLARSGSDPLKLHSIDERRLLTANLKLNSKTQSALNAYESMLYQSEKEERESISRLLGVDLYV